MRLTAFSVLGPTGGGLALLDHAEACRMRAPWSELRALWHTIGTALIHSRELDRESAAFMQEVVYRQGRRWLPRPWAHGLQTVFEFFQAGPEPPHARLRWQSRSPGALPGLKRASKP